MYPERSCFVCHNQLWSIPEELISITCFYSFSHYHSAGLQHRKLQEDFPITQIFNMPPIYKAASPQQDT